MPNTFTIVVEGDEEVVRMLNRIAADVKDVSYAWDFVVQEWRDIQTDRFNTRGFGQWAPLSPGYAAWKARHAPGQPLLVLTGDLRQAAIQGATAAKSATELRLGVGAGVPYWRFHQTGTRKMPARPVTSLDANQVNRLARAFTKGVIDELKRDS